MLNQNCKACKHFQDHGQMGVCRRFPTYQNRHHTEICGEFYALPVIPVEQEFTVTVQDVVKKQRGRPRVDK
ncbi:hypothetical protein UFOVP43_42 [uncultured Caudovirales phage]|uniref:Uncharacterized protein n=1 Tax=uncultured Caudovirales phage TaxID=2100421 RepID=A0A6J5KNP6_9CAUD|nr:hypothetical protein UFOVP43_42 [uncultured Caudovirales phage]